MINQSNIFKKIGYILNELQDQYQFLSENPEQLSELELELFLANANFLSDHVEIVRKLNNNKPLKQLQESVAQPVIGDERVEQAKVEPKESEMETKASALETSHTDQVTSPSAPDSGKDEGLLIEQIEREELHQDDLPPTFEFIIDRDSVTDKFSSEEKPIEDKLEGTLSREEESSSYSNASVKHDDAGQDTEPFLVNAENPAPVPPAAVSTNVPVAPAIKESQQPYSELVPDKVEEKKVPVASADLVVDKVEEKVVAQTSPSLRPTLNDLLAGNAGSGKTEEAAKPTITDLKRSITLNEKLLYIKDLFNGYNLAYSEAIDIINKMPDLKSADAFLKNNYAIKNNWEEKQSTVNQFYDLLSQRFPVG